MEKQRSEAGRDGRTKIKVPAERRKGARNEGKKEVKYEDHETGMRRGGTKKALIAAISGRTMKIVGGGNELSQVQGLRFSFDRTEKRLREGAVGTGGFDREGAGEEKSS